MAEEKISPGKYLMRAESWGLGLAGTGTEQVEVLFVVKLAEEVKDAGGRVVTPARATRMTKRFFFSSDKALRISLKALACMGWTGDDLDELCDGGGGLDRNEVEGDIQKKPDYVRDGQTYDGGVEIAFVNPVGGSLRIANPMDRQQAAAWSKKMRGLIAATRAEMAGGSARDAARTGGGNGGARGAPAGGPSAVRPDAAADDDIPF
jgi:hypothetical protein